MKVSDLLTYCMAKRGAEQSEHEEWQATQIKADGVLFAMLYDLHGRPAVALKSTPALAELIRDQHSDVQPSEHLNPSHWNTVLLDGSLKDSQIYYLVDASFQQVQK